MIDLSDVTESLNPVPDLWVGLPAFMSLIITGHGPQDHTAP